MMIDKVKEPKLVVPIATCRFVKVLFGIGVGLERTTYAWTFESYTPPTELAKPDEFVEHLV